jgi:cyanophycin synthetase
MKILTLKVLNGPNYWSNYRKKLIEMKLDLEAYEHLPTNLIDGFNERLQTLRPTLFTHRCSIGTEGGLFKRMEEGTWLGHVIEHVALELQCLAGMDCGFGRTFSAHETGVYHVVFAYETAAAGEYVAKAAVTLVEMLAKGEAYPTLDQDIETLKNIFEQDKLGPSSQAIVDEANRRNIPVTPIHGSLIKLGQGKHQKTIWATMSSATSAIGMDIAANKDLTKQILDAHFIRVPEGIMVHSLEALNEAVKQLGFPLVIKPLNSNHGKGISTNINALEKAISGFKLAQKTCREVIVEKYITGDDYRFLIVNYRVVAVARRTPAMIVGTGVHTVQALIDEVNNDPKRGSAHENYLTTIKIDEATLQILEENGFSLSTIVPKDKVIYLKYAANLSTGGTAVDVTAEVHPYNLRLAERIARLIDLDICGIDLISPDIKVPFNENDAAVIEVNASPGFRMHLSPNQGSARNVARPVIDMLYPPGSLARVPTVAVTGTNGKTTVVRLIAHLASQMGHHVGFTTTEGIYLNGELVYQGDCSGPQSAKMVLQNSLVDFAVLECARGGILRSGLGFDSCDISIITNISSDHLGLNDIHTLEQLAKVKSVVAQSTAPDGYAILNAENDLVYALKKDLTCHVALFGMEENERIKAHCLEGGLAAYIQNEVIVVQKAHQKNELIHLKEIPLGFQGTALLMIQNILPAVLAGIISHFPKEKLLDALRHFYPTADNLPGRMNLFNFDTYQVMVDYAHNEAAFLEIKHYLNALNCIKKVGIIGATGDRRPEDIQKIGYYAALIFDEIIIRHDQDGRGKTNQELTELLMQGITLSSFQPEVKIISEEFEAIEYAMNAATPGTFIYYTVDDVFVGVEHMKAIELEFKTMRHADYDTKREATHHRWC